jgi:SAM-dependent methyltransferase
VAPSIAYDAVAPVYARHRGAMPFVVEILKRLSTDGPVLEVGCGTGAYITAMMEATPSTGVGLDPSPGMLERAPESEHIHYVQGCATSLPLADQSVGTIFSVNVAHHLTNISRYFREAIRVLGPGGILCTATDSRAIIERRAPLSRYWPCTVAVELARYHDIETLRSQMDAAGFRDIDECEGRSQFSVSDIGPYRDKAYSCLQAIPEEAFTRGLRALESDLRAGPIEGNSELVFLSGRRA